MLPCSMRWILTNYNSMECIRCFNSGSTPWCSTKTVTSTRRSIEDLNPLSPRWKLTSRTTSSWQHRLASPLGAISLPTSHFSGPMMLDHFSRTAQQCGPCMSTFLRMQNKLIINNINDLIEVKIKIYMFNSLLWTSPDVQLKIFIRHLFL